MSTGLDEAVAAVVAVVCDWNGTIVNDADRALQATNRVLDEYGLARIDAAQFRDGFCLPLRAFMMALGIPAAGMDAAVSIWNAALMRGATRLQPGVGEMLAAARQAGLPVGVVSAAEAAVVRVDAVALGVEADLAFIAGAVASKSAALAEISARLGGRILYAGDTEYDILEAKKAGAVAIGFGGGYRPAAALAAAGPLIVLNGFFQLASAIRRTRPHAGL